MLDKIDFTNFDGEVSFIKYEFFSVSINVLRVEMDSTP